MLKSYTYVMSDIHGQYETFIKMLEKIKFKKDDKLFIIGDVIDRGNNPIKLLLHIMNEENIILLCGNHEYMAVLCLKYLLTDKKDVFDSATLDLVDMLSNWKMNGGGTTLKEIFECDKKTREKIFNYLIKLKLYKEVEVCDNKFLLVHAGLGNFNKNKKMKEYYIDDLVWERMDYNKVYYDDKIIITGHTPTQLIKGNKNPGKIYKNGLNIDIDCGCAFGDTLGCLRLDDMKEFYVKC